MFSEYPVCGHELLVGPASVSLHADPPSCLALKPLHWFAWGAAALAAAPAAPKKGYVFFKP